jgi:hypothetical protein
METPRNRAVSIKENSGDKAKTADTLDEADDAAANINIPAFSRLSSSPKHTLYRGPVRGVKACDQTRVEALWRILIADVWDSQYPALKEGSFALADWLIVNMVRLSIPSVSLNRPEEFANFRNSFRQVAGFVANDISIRSNPDICHEYENSLDFFQILHHEQKAAYDWMVESESSVCGPKSLLYVPKVELMKDITVTTHLPSSRNSSSGGVSHDFYGVQCSTVSELDQKL